MLPLFILSAAALAVVSALVAREVWRDGYRRLPLAAVEDRGL